MRDGSVIYHLIVRLSRYRCAHGSSELWIWTNTSTAAARAMLSSLTISRGKRTIRHSSGTFEANRPWETRLEGFGKGEGRLMCPYPGNLSETKHVIGDTSTVRLLVNDGFICPRRRGKAPYQPKMSHPECVAHNRQRSHTLMHHLSLRKASVARHI